MGMSSIGLLDIFDEQIDDEMVENLPGPEEIKRLDLFTFYDKAGHFHSVTEDEGASLTKYQIACWYDRWNEDPEQRKANRLMSKYRLYLKSQKLGMTTFFLMEDFHVALTDGMGKEILIVAQTKDKARSHLQALKKYILSSPEYSQFLITNKRNKGDDLLADERSKTDVLYLRNTIEPTRPTKIIALGITAVGSLISFMNVQHIHMSDVTMAQMVDENMKQAFGGLFSRLANSRGTMIIECPPRSPSGPVWDIVNDAPELKKDGHTVELDDEPIYIEKNGFLVRRLTYKLGIEAGLMDEKFILHERNHLGVMFGMYYETDFYSSDETFFPKDVVNRANPWSKEQAVVINRVQADLANSKQNFDGEDIKTYDSDIKFTNPAKWKRQRDKAKRDADKYRDQSMSAEGRSGTREWMGNIVDNEPEIMPMTEDERNQAIKESIESEKDDMERIKRLSSKRHIRNAFGNKKRNSKKG